MVIARAHAGVIGLCVTLRTSDTFYILRSPIKGVMSGEASKSVVREYLSAFNDRDWQELEELVAPDVFQHGIHGELEGAEEIVGFLEGHFDAFPDYAGHNEAIVAEDDLVVVRYHASGTHTGEYKDVEPTGIRATWTGMSMYRVEDGQIAEIWIEEDRLGLLEQLEMVDSTERAHLRL